MEKPIKREIYTLRLNRSMRDLLLEITNLDNDFGCIASNQFLAESLRLKPDTISRYISKLKDLGYVTEEKFNGRIRTLSSAFSGKKSNTGQEKNPMQNRKRGKPEEGRGAKFSDAELEKNQILSTLQNTSKNVRTNFKEIDLEKIWESFTDWTKTNLTPSTQQAVKNLKCEISGESIHIVGEVSWSLQEMIERYLLVEKKLQLKLEFIEKENSITLNEDKILLINTTESHDIQNEKVLILSDYFKKTTLINHRVIAL